MVFSWLPDLGNTPDPRYRRVAAVLARDIRSGHLGVGEKLPTHRALAEALGVTVNRVTKAHKEAERAGLVVSRVGRSTFVQRFPEAMAADAGRPPDVIDLGTNIALANTFDPVLVRSLGALSSRGSLHARLLNYSYPGVDRIGPLPRAGSRGAVSTRGPVRSSCAMARCGRP